MSICYTCHSNCCRKLDFVLTGFDILKISKALELGPQFFTEIVEIKNKKDLEKIKLHYAIFNFSDNFNKNPFYFKLKKVSSSLIQDTLKCIFLQEWNITGSINESGIIGRCGIYSCRPFECYSFPAKYNEIEKNIIIEDVKAKYYQNKEEAYKLCSEKFQLTDFQNSSDELVSNINNENYEKEFFKQIAIKWNNNPGSIETFFKHLEKFYQQRIIVK
ncbi:MAG: hypothetical protein AB1782_04515 [Cyanobacteriota bacterium]